MRLLSCANGPPHVSYVMALNAKCHGAANMDTAMEPYTWLVSAGTWTHG